MTVILAPVRAVASVLAEDPETKNIASICSSPGHHFLKACITCIH
jgi:hypothetical protein